MADVIEKEIQNKTSKEEGNNMTAGRKDTVGQFCGWLSERSAATTLRLSSKRWCVLDGQQLFVYDSREAVKPIKALHLPQFQVRMIVGDMDTDDDDEDDGGHRSDESDPTERGSQGQFLLELRPKQVKSSGGDVYLFAAETEQEFNSWGKLLSINAKPKKSTTPNRGQNTSNSGISNDQVQSKSHQNGSKPEPISLTQVSVTVNSGGSTPNNGSPSQKRHISRTISAPFSPYTKEKAEFDLHQILQRADFTFWEEEEPGDKSSSPRSKSISAGSPHLQPMETCLLAPSTKKSPSSTPTHSPPMPRRADMRYSSLPADTRIQVSPRTKRSKSAINKSPKDSPTGSPSLRKRVSKRLGASWDRNSWGGGGSPKASPDPSRKSWGFGGGQLSEADFNDSYGIFEMRSSQRLKGTDGEIGNGGMTGMSQENPVVSILLDYSDRTANLDNARPRSATVSSSTSTSSEEQSGGLKASSGQFNRTLSFITRMKEANKHKRKMRQIPISADDIVNPAKTGFVKISNKGKATSIKRCYAVLKDEWLYLYKKPADTCTLDAYDMPSYVVSANVGSDSIRNFKHQKLSISLEHKVTGDVTILISEAAIEIFEWAEKLQKSSKDQGLAMAGLNLEQGRSRPKLNSSGKPFISAPIMQSDEINSQSEMSKDDEQLAELHRHRLIQDAMKENQQLILGTQTLKESPEQFPLGPSQSPRLQRQREDLENKYRKASEEEEHQAMVDLTLLKRRRISTQVKQDTILRQLEARKQKKKNKRQEEEALMRKQLDELNAKLSKINSEIQSKSQQKEQKLQAFKERKALELQVLEQQNQLIRYRKAAQDALENIMENAPVQRQSLSFISDESSDDGERHTASDTDSPREERSDSQLSQLSVESVPGISLQRPSIDVGVPGPTFVLQRSSVELQVGPQIQVEPTQQSQNASVCESVLPRSTSSGDTVETKGSHSAKTKRRLLPAIPGSPGSSRSNSPPSNSGSDSDHELRIVEKMDSKMKNSNVFSDRKERTEVTGAKLSVPGHSSPVSSESGSDSPQRVRKNSTGRILPEIPSGHRSRSSSSSMDVRSDDSMDISEKSRNGGSDYVDSRRTKSNSVGDDSMMDTYSDTFELSDANGNHVTSKTIYLRPNGQGKTKPRPKSEAPDMHRLSVPGGSKKKQRSASEGMRTEISPDVLKDIEDFEQMARAALRNAGWQIPI
ncbi:LOW QUALITY PROTEIN: uncharacterized protein [Amphiura filiformis]|uniref:LOW QUALITY PROTEIN: uncharacterized protein n=1 Tax=Amphiura filiformis TaxID=82378 RepID=UPI003B2154C5